MTTTTDAKTKVHPRNSFLRRLDRVPLSSRLVSILMILLAVGLSVAAFTTRQLVWTYMIDRTDSQLTRQATLVISNIKELSEHSSGPTDYFLQIRDSNYQILGTPLVPTMRDGVTTIPNLPASGSMGNIKIGTPTTVTSQVVTSSADQVTGSGTASASPWRVVALKWRSTDQDTGESSQGVFFIGLSLSDAMDTSSAIARYFLVVGFLILALAMALGTLVISKTLIPLKRIEKTAAKIAAGDLSMRIPEAPENTEVGSLSKSLNIMLARIEHSFREQEATTNKMKQFVSDASHELRTPLAAIHGYAELYRMQRNLPDALERADETIGRIEVSSTRMTTLVEDLLSLARLDEGRGADVSRKVRLDTILADVGEDLHALDPMRPVQLGALTLKSGVVGMRDSASTRVALSQFEEKPLDAVHVLADPSRLRQVFTNIVGNIHRYTPQDSPVQISLNVVHAAIDPARVAELGTGPEALGEFISAVEVASASGRGNPYVFIRFVDHGPGVKPESLGRLFERFYTADPSRAREKGGTGLGMAITKSVMRAHHGFVCATQTPGGGLTINIGLPVPTEECAKRSQDPTSGTTTGPTSNGSTSDGAVKNGVTGKNGNKSGGKKSLRRATRGQRRDVDSKHSEE
ncbi:MAG: HAMP domain-containing histidine kinase [Bifidobacteriaceae bacterium]|nr:HAMP domain-containing histidine kinase [Bifidobacteriaceae bacterium]MCI1978826.1 HAMP domain-containing histidine kinase [Bifidobacteriaceae bacterium]